MSRAGTTPAGPGAEEAAPRDRAAGGAWEEHPGLRARGAARLVPPTRGGRVALAVVKAAFVALGVFLLLAGSWALAHAAAPDAAWLQPAVAFRALPAAALGLGAWLAWRDARRLEAAWSARAGGR